MGDLRCRVESGLNLRLVPAPVPTADMTLFCNAASSL